MNTRRVTGPLPAALLAITLLVGGCSSGAVSHPASPAPVPAARLAASVAQFRFDEGTHRLSAGVTNHAGRAITVTRATITGAGLAFAAVTLPRTPIPPGQTAAFTATYGAPSCARPPTGAPRLVATIDGRRRSLPLHVDEPGLLGRLRAAACSRERLDRVASVRLVLDRRERRLRGQWFVAGRIDLRHRGGATEPVHLVDLGGSVLIELSPRAGRRVLPVTLPASQDTVSLPVLFGYGRRCDGHALGQSSQTFLMSGYVRLAGDATQRVIFPLTSAERDRLIAMVHRNCRANP